MLRPGLERFAIRYLVQDEELPPLLRALAVRLKPDPEGAYAVTTLHFEPAAGAGSPRRNLRVRTLSGARGERTFVELLHVVGRRSWKQRAEATIEQALAACRGERSGGASHLLEDAAALARDVGFAPSFAVRSERRGFVADLLDEPDLRVTVDSNLRHRTERLTLLGRDEDGWLETLPRGTHLVEVRVARALPSWLHHALERAGCREHAPGCGDLARRAG